MVPHTKTAPNTACSNDCSVGLLDVCELQDKEFTSHLSSHERALYMGLRNESRKREWLAGRLSAKYLFLNRLDLPHVTQSQQWRPTLSKLSLEALGVYSPWMYQKVEVLPNGGMPSLVWCGKDRPESISLSHAGGFSCASIALGATTAIDLETAVPRNDAFYTNNFSEAEINWAARRADGESISSSWSFTLLWTLKESALKLGWLNHASLWNLPRIEIDGLPRLDHIGRVLCSSTMDEDFVVFTARVKDPRRVMKVRVAVTGTRNLVLTVMNPLIGAIN